MLSDRTSLTLKTNQSTLRGCFCVLLKLAPVIRLALNSPQRSSTIPFYGNVELPLVHARVQSQGDGLVPSPSDTLSYRHDVR